VILGFAISNIKHMLYEGHLQGLNLYSSKQGRLWFDQTERIYSI